MNDWVNHRFISISSRHTRVVVHRQLSVLLGALGLVVMAGCAGGLSGEALVFTASEITVDETAVRQADFSVTTDKEIVFEQEFEVQDQSVAVELNTHMVHLQRSYTGAPLGLVMVLATPQIEILGEQIDIADQFDPIDLIGQAQDSVDKIERHQQIDEWSVRILGEEQIGEMYKGTAEQDAESAQVTIFVTTFEYDDDTISGVGIIPEETTDQQDVLVVFESLQSE